MLMYSQASISTLIKKKNKEGPKFKIGDHVRISKYFCIKLSFILVWRSSCGYKS